MSVYTDPVLVIGNKNYSSWSLRAWLAFRKANVHVELKRLPLDTPEFAKEIRDYSPSGRVPVLIDDGRKVWDSLAICEYVSENMDEGHLWPRNYVERGYARSISAEMHSGFAALREQMPMNARATGRKVPMTPELEADINRINEMWVDCRQKHITHGPWLFGYFTIADAMYAPVALRFHTYGVQLDPLAEQYMHHVLSDADVQSWVADARQEPEVLEGEEKGA